MDTCACVCRTQRLFGPHPQRRSLQETDTSTARRHCSVRFGSHPFHRLVLCMACEGAHRRWKMLREPRRASHVDAVHATIPCGEETPLARVPGCLAPLWLGRKRHRYLGFVPRSWPRRSRDEIETCPVGRGRWLRWPPAKRRWPRPRRREEGEAVASKGNGRKGKGTGESDVSLRDPRTKSDPKEKRTGRKLLKHVRSKQGWLQKLPRCNSLNRRGLI